MRWLKQRKCCNYLCFIIAALLMRKTLGNIFLAEEKNTTKATTTNATQVFWRDDDDGVVQSDGPQEPSDDDDCSDEGFDPGPAPCVNNRKRPTSTPSDPPSSSPTQRKANLIVIMTDEHNYRTLSCYRDHWAKKVSSSSTDVWGNSTRIHTPNIDKLASEGTLYSNFYTVAPRCTPSRASFMTGLYPAFTGDSELNHGAMDGNMKTFANVLEDERGYDTAYLGKWHLDGYIKPGWWGDDGIDGRWFGFNDNKYRFNRGHFKWIDEVKGNMVGYKINAEDSFKGREDKHFTTDYLIDRGIEFMDRALDKDKAFAMVISIPDPHGPNQNRGYYRNLYKNLNFDVPETANMAMSFDPAAPGWNFIDLNKVPLDEVDEYIDEYEDSDKWQNDMQQYYGMVSCIDHNVGKLLDALKDRDIDDDTILVFTSDHGDLLMEHARVNKGEPYETSAGIPFLVRYPGTVSAGKVIETAYSSVDFAPTILGLMGVSNPGVDFHGVDGSEELLDSSTMTSLNEEKIIFSMDVGISSMNSGIFSMGPGSTPGWAMAQMGHYKLVISNSDGPWLFDLVRDPEEVQNFINSNWHKVIRITLRDALVEALFRYEMPLTRFTDAIFVDWPACFDKRDILPLTNGRLARCHDIGGMIDAEECQNQAEVANHCPVTCGTCCWDTEGVIVVDAQVYYSCSDLKNKCGIGQVKIFCPETCNVC